MFARRKGGVREIKKIEMRIKKNQNKLLVQVLSREFINIIFYNLVNVTKMHYTHVYNRNIEN